jgi:endonuclease/exonuclease/phosphatase family metal-dependent hydrolase
VRRIISTLALVVCALAPQPASARGALRLVHWNIFYSGTGTDGVRDPARQVDVLAALSPDVITLNEITARAAVDYASRLQRATGVRWHHHFARSRERDEWGNAILSRHPIVSTDVRRLEIGDGRSIAQATVAVNGSRVSVFAAHLDSGNNGRSRAAQARELLAWIARFPAPRLVGGDMNAGPDAPEIQPLFSDLEDAWLAAVYSGTARAYAANPAHRYTRTRRTRIDYILTSRDVRVRECRIPDLRDLSNTKLKTVVGSRDDDGVRPSDHNLVTCVLAWNGGPPSAAPPPVLDEEEADAGRDELDAGGVPDTLVPDTATCPAPAPAADGLEAGAAALPRSNDEIVLRPAGAATLTGNWIVQTDCTAAGGAAVVNPNLALPRTRAMAEPADYFEMTFDADAGKPYRLWIRARAASDGWRNDSVSVQFSGAVDALGRPVFRIGTTDRTIFRLEECIGCDMSGWGWQDNGYGPGVLGPEIWFETSGPQTIRIQRREDGIRIDQVVLSPAAWLTSPPGATLNDATILPAR